MISDFGTSKKAIKHGKDVMVAQWQSASLVMTQSRLFCMGCQATITWYLEPSKYSKKGKSTKIMGKHTQFLCYLESY